MNKGLGGDLEHSKNVKETSKMCTVGMCPGTGLGNTGIDIVKCPDTPNNIKEQELTKADCDFACVWDRTRCNDYRQWPTYMYILCLHESK